MSKKSSSRKPRVLVVDDEPHLISAYIEYLRRSATVVVEDNPLNVEKHLEWKPDVAVLDVNMDVRDGFECGHILRDHDPDCELIYMTAARNDEAEQLLLDEIRQGIAFYLVFPFDVAILPAVVHRSAESRRLRIAVREDLERAKDLQEQMRKPRTARCANGYELSYVQVAASELCGDLVDYDVSATTTRVLVADAMGHGTRAALIFALLSTVFRERTRNGDGITEIGHELMMLADKMPSGFIVTLVLLEVNHDTQAIEYISFGHNPFVIIRNSGVIQPMESTTSLAGGGLANAPLQTAGSQVLADGESIVLYTDGVVEARTRLGKQIGYGGLAQIIESRDIATVHNAADVIYSTLEASILQTDDISLVVINKPE